MDGICNTHGRDGKCVHNLSGNPKKMDHSRDQVAEERIILNWMLRTKDMRI
jgi:hypothetical protein